MIFKVEGNKRDKRVYALVWVEQRDFMGDFYKNEFSGAIDGHDWYFATSEDCYDIYEGEHYNTDRGEIVKEVKRELFK